LNDSPPRRESAAKCSTPPLTASPNILSQFVSGGAAAPTCRRNFGPVNAQPINIQHICYSRPGFQLTAGGSEWKALPNSASLLSTPYETNKLIVVFGQRCNMFQRQLFSRLLVQSTPFGSSGLQIGAELEAFLQGQLQEGQQ
jgi:hypothetical protein